MKQLLSAVFLTVFMLFMSVNATAYDTSLADKSGATALTDEYGTETDFSRVFHVIRDSLGEYLKTVTKSVLLLLSVVILSSVFSIVLRRDRHAAKRTVICICACSIMRRIFNA